ncbi:hypothetical protein FLW53_09665 [Microbispora sp. SCL1-1]|uniref:hypothetical protein n=1 Tax=unclassified Microbispora TaxID=2614687 RepID=UPI001156FC89|nr:MULTISPECIES: hypothetical protein [unclassified Microbispora]NJP24471.1 hypothetical protein [Microbispora sp. CL1-1]TQS14617.1 hypothetical protein FLW53_09665 [Microbispora sp. SCL1-1]
MRRFLPLADHPFELLFGVIALLGGVALVAAGAAPASINATLPVLVVKAWGLVQAGAGALIVSGIITRYWRPALLLVGLRLERAGLWPLAAACAVYGVVAVVHAGPRAMYPGGVLMVIAAACVARARAVSRLEATIRKYVGGSGGE